MNNNIKYVSNYNQVKVYLNKVDKGVNQTSSTIM